MSLPWFRLYSEFASDPKIQLLAFEDQRHFVVLLCLKSTGTLDTKSISQSHFDRMICKALGLDSATGTEVKRRLSEVGLIDETWQPLRWDDRQKQSDSSAERAKKYREKQKKPFASRDGDGLDKIRVDKIRVERPASPTPVTKKVSKSKTSIPSDLTLTEELKSYAEERLPNVDASALMENFQGMAKAKAWKYADWNQAWQTMVRQWAPNSGHWSSGQYSRKLVADDRPSWIDANGKGDLSKVRWP